MNARHVFIGGVVASAMLLSGCASSPYIDPPNWLTSENSPVWTAAERARFVDSIEPGETTLGEVVGMYGPAMAYSGDASGGQRTSELFWYGETGLDQPWAAVVVPGGYRDWNESSPVLSVATSGGLKKGRGTESATAVRSSQTASTPPAKPATPREATAAAPAASSQNRGAPNVTAALADGVIRPNEIDNEVAAAMAAFGEAGGTVSSFRSRFGPEAEYDEDTRLFRKVGATLFYGSGYGEGASIWVEFDGDNRYESTMIHVPRGGNRAPYERFF
jgi:hypothetical protein